MKIVLANSGSFDDAYFSEPLTSYAQDYYRNFEIEKFLEFSAGSVVVPHRFQYRQWGSASDLVKGAAPDPRRAMGANFSAIPVSGTIQLGETDNKGYSVILDDDEINADPKWETVAVRKALRTLMEYERDFVGFNTIYSNATVTSVTWNGGSGQDPDSDLITLLESIETASGLRPNRLIFTPTTWAARLKTLRAQSGFAAAASAMQSPDELGAMLGAKVMILDVGATAIGTSAVVSAVYQQEGGMSDDVSSIKRFQSLCKDGQLFRAYKRMVGNKTWEITVEHYSKTIAVYTTSIGALGVTTT